MNKLYNTIFDESIDQTAIEKEFDNHFDSLNEETKEIMCKILEHHTKQHYPVMNSINHLSAQLAKKGCRKIIISLAGEDDAGRKIEHEQKITITALKTYAS
jgi:hypothetical protein